MRHARTYEEALYGGITSERPLHSFGKSRKGDDGLIAIGKALIGYET